MTRCDGGDDGDDDDEDMKEESRRKIWDSFRERWRWNEKAKMWREKKKKKEKKTVISNVNTQNTQELESLENHHESKHFREKQKQIRIEIQEEQTNERASKEANKLCGKQD